MLAHGVCITIDGVWDVGAALRHFQQTGKQFPLVVKLGTITPHGADVYSYAEDEDDIVLDPFLQQHLAHWGINMLEMEKTEKTMAELQVRASTAAQTHEIFAFICCTRSRLGL